MRIGIVGSMHHSELMLELQNELRGLGHDAFLSKFANDYVAKNDEEKETIKIHQKNNLDAIREFWNLMQDGEAILVVNKERYGIENYIGGNTFLEMGFAHVLKQKIFLLNPIPEMIYTTEITAMKPVVINGDLAKIK